jgi:diacylglycerol kinase (ATP)
LSEILSAQARLLPIIYNPAAGQRRSAFFTRVLSALEARGWRAELRTTARAGDAKAMAAAAARAGAARIAVAGGDGTIHEAVNGLAAAPQKSGSAGPLLGIIPLGTANVLAQEIGLPLKPEAVAACLTGQKELSTRLGRIGEGVFLLMAGAGFDAQVVAQVSIPLKRKFGKGAYVWETLRQAFGYGFPELDLELDGRPERARSLILARAAHYGGAFLLSREAGLEKETLQAFLLEEGGPLSVLRCSLALAMGRLEGARGVRRLPVEKVKILGPTGLPLQADGDHVGATPVEIGLSERRLRLLVP